MKYEKPSPVNVRIGDSVVVSLDNTLFLYEVRRVGVKGVLASHPEGDGAFVKYEDGIFHTHNNRVLVGRVVSENSGIESSVGTLEPKKPGLPESFDRWIDWSSPSPA